MKKLFHFVFLLLLLGANAAIAAVELGQNLVINGEMEAEQLDFPSFWSSNNRIHVSFDATTGPHGRGSLNFCVGGDAETGSATVRQHGLKLVAGGEYKITAWVKTKNFKSGHYGIVVHNSGWRGSNGMTQWPETLEQWTKLENTFTLLDSRDGSYGFGIYAQNFTGELQVADVKLEAICPKALAESDVSTIVAEQNRLRLVPWTPLLNQIPLAEPKLSFHLFGFAAKTDVADYDCVFTLDGREIQKSVLQQKLNVLDLSGIPKGDHQLEAAIIKRDTGEKVFSLASVITLLTMPPVDASGHRRFNNLVTEILRQELHAKADEQIFTFDNPRDGWIYAAVQSAATAPNLTVEIADLGTVITAATDRTETFRHLPRGRHQIKVQGASTGGTLQVRSIAEIFNYPACTNNQVSQNGKYDWDFHLEHVFPAVTTLYSGTIPEEHLSDFKERGLRWLCRVHATNPKSADDLVDRLKTRSANISPFIYDGFACDEQFFGHPYLTYYTEAMRRFKNTENHLIYTWIVGKPTMPAVHSDFISACVNVSRGRGRLLYEAYCPSRPTEEAARSYLANRLVDTMERFNDYFPHAAAGTGMILGNFNQIPLISVDVFPEVDYKYYLDMQLNLIANHEAFQNLATAGYWGCHYSDEELLRWSLALLRHYCVEGNTTMMSDQYGYRYNPGHLRNGDFRQGMENWAVAPAATDSVRATSFVGYGKGPQRRWSAGPGVGDTFCLFTRQDDRPNAISQTATGLTPGKVYTLQFVTADYQDMIHKRFNPRRHGINAILDSTVEILAEQSYVFVDKRNTGKKKNDGQARINLHHIRFRPQNESLTVTFLDMDAEPGEQLALNYIMMKPYFE